jgi:hypothetical protein
MLIWTCVGRYSAHRGGLQAFDLSLFTADESLLLDPGLDYRSIDGLSSEIKPGFSHLTTFVFKMPREGQLDLPTDLDRAVWLATGLMNANPRLHLR